jgi:hypothetical protein
MNAPLGFVLRLLEEYQHQLAMAYFCLAALSWKYWLKTHRIFLAASLTPMVAALAVVVVSVYLLKIIFYLVYPNYFDHVQPEVASISWLWMQGHELYPDWTSSDVYGVVYGPILFLLNGIALLLNPSIFASKLPGVLSLAAALGTTWILFKRTTASNLASLFLLASLLLLCDIFGGGFYAFWNRAEPFLILISVLALLIASRSSFSVMGVSIGVLAGVAVGLKLHGFIYVVPAAAVALARVETLRGRLLLTTIGSVCTATSAILPYLVKGVSVGGYWRFLKVPLDQHWFAYATMENLLIVFALSAPIIMIWSQRKQPLSAPDRWLLGALSLSAVTVTVLGAKMGAGSYYLLPLVPIVIYGIARVCASETKAKQIAALLFVSFFLAYGPNLLLNLKQLKYWYQVTPWQGEQIAELKTYIDLYPDAQIGVSDDAHYSNYFYRVLSVWKGRALHVDFSTWMDLASVNVDEEHIMRFIRGCAVRTWILPLGTPFAKINWYGWVPLVTDNFRQTFANTYEQVMSGQAYQIWRCKLTHSGTAGQEDMVP